MGLRVGRDGHLSDLLQDSVLLLNLPPSHSELGGFPTCEMGAEPAQPLPRGPTGENLSVDPVTAGAGPPLPSPPPALPLKGSAPDPDPTALGRRLSLPQSLVACG